MFIIRLAILYLVAGAIILLVQLSYSTCDKPVALFNGQSYTAGPIDLNRLGHDRAYAIRLGQDVAFWLPRFVDQVVMGDSSVKDFFLARRCVT